MEKTASGAFHILNQMVYNMSRNLASQIRYQ
jgi:hypothetical protein